MGTFNDAKSYFGDMDTFDQIGALTGFNPIAAGNFVGDFLGLSNGKAVDAAMDSYDSVMDTAGQYYKQNLSDLSKYGDMLQDVYGYNASKYNDALDALLSSDVFQAKPFEYTGDINDFYDKFANQRSQQAMDAIRNSFGDSMSSEYQNAIAAKQQALASEEWENAYNKLMRDRELQRAEWQANNDTLWKNYDAQMGRYKDAVDAYGRDRDALLQGQGDVLSNTINARNANLTTLSDLTQAKANAAMQRQSGNSSVLGMAGSIIGSIL